jgi:hypothetical protein
MGQCEWFQVYFVFHFMSLGLEDLISCCLSARRNCCSTVSHVCFFFRLVERDHKLKTLAKQSHVAMLDGSPVENPGDIGRLEETNSLIGKMVACQFVAPLGAGLVMQVHTGTHGFLFGVFSGAGTLREPRFSLPEELTH